MLEKKNTKAFKEGVAARGQQKSFVTNPYPDDTDDNNDWFAGWQYESAHLHIAGHDMESPYLVLALLDDKWHALRSMQQRDYSCVHLDPKPDWCPKRTFYRGTLMAADLIAHPITEAFADKFNITGEKLKEMNDKIVADNQQGE